MSCCTAWPWLTRQNGRAWRRNFCGGWNGWPLARDVEAFRVDTNFDNRIMLRLLEKEGCSFCGKIRYDSGERLAFEKSRPKG